MSKTDHMDIEEAEQYAAEIIEREEFDEAERLLSSLFDQGSVYAPTALAWLYENGCLGGRDAKQAQYYYEQAISRGNRDATLDLGLLLLEDNRLAEARTVFEKGAETGHIGCIAELGWMLVNGIGGDIHKARGREMLEESARRGHLLAQRRIISLDIAGRPSIFNRIRLLGRLAVVAKKVFFEAYRDRRSDKIW